MKLTQKQETFTRNLFSGMSQYDAYREAGYAVVKQARGTINANASRLANNVNIKQLLDELNEKAEDASIASKKELMKFHTVIVRSPHCPMCGVSPQAHQGTQIKASAELSKLGGYYAQPESGVNIDNRTVNIYTNSDKAKELTQKLIEGERTE